MGVEWTYQQALFGVLDAAKAAIGVKGVYDQVPQQADAGSQAAFPYLLLGDIHLNPADARGEVGFYVDFRLHAVTRQLGRKQAKLIQGQVFEILHNKPMAVAGFNHVLLQRRNSFTREGADSNIRGVCEYNALIHKV